MPDATLEPRALPEWLGRRAFTIAATIALTALVTSSGATLAKVVTSAELSGDNAVILDKHSTQIKAQEKTLRMVVQNQRLMICEMKAKDGKPCVATDLLFTPPKEQ